ncbi:MAG: hypothetical protein WAK11_11585 [Candidatus Cybelea sp.]
MRRIWDARVLTPRVLGITAAVSWLSGYGGSQPPIGASGAMPRKASGPS